MVEPVSTAVATDVFIDLAFLHFQCLNLGSRNEVNQEYKHVLRGFVEKKKGYVNFTHAVKPFIHYTA